MSFGWDVKWCPMSKITILGTQFHWISMESRLVRAARETSKISKLITFNRRGLVAAIIWLKYCRYGVKHYQINHSILNVIKISLTFQMTPSLQQIPQMVH